MEHFYKKNPNCYGTVTKEHCKGKVLQFAKSSFLWSTSTKITSIAKVW
jgi:hypothetical protein